MGIQQFDEAVPVFASAAPPNGAAGGTLATFDLPSAGNVRLDNILAYSLQNIGYTLTLWYTPSGGSAIPLGTVNVPAGAGSGGSAATDVLAALFPTNYHYIVIARGDALAISLSVTQSTTGSELTFGAYATGGIVG